MATTRSTTRTLDRPETGHTPARESGGRLRLVSACGHLGEAGGCLCLHYTTGDDTAAQIAVSLLGTLPPELCRQLGQALLARWAWAESAKPRRR